MLICVKLGALRLGAESLVWGDDGGSTRGSPHLLLQEVSGTCDIPLNLGHFQLEHSPVKKAYQAGVQGSV